MTEKEDTVEYESDPSACENYPIGY